MNAFRAKYMKPGNIIGNLQVLNPFIDPDELVNKLGEPIETIEADHPNIDLRSANTYPSKPTCEFFSYFNTESAQRFSAYKLDWLEDTYDEYVDDFEPGNGVANEPMTQYEFLAKEMAEVVEFYKYINSEVFPDTDTRKVYTEIDYPVTRKCIMCFTIKKDVPITFGVLMYLHILSYQLMYKLDTVLNDDGNHPYGIWGHQISDLVYNGNRKIVCCDDGILCNFDCDS